MPKPTNIANIFSKDGSSAHFESNSPNRSLGIFLCFFSLLGMFLVYISIMLMTDGKPRDNSEGLMFMIIGIVTTLGALLPGLYYSTYRRIVRIDQSSVIHSRKWCLGSKDTQLPLGAYAGVLCEEKIITSGNAAAGAVAFGLIGALIAGAVSKKHSVMYYLHLKHTSIRSRDAVLFSNPNQAAVQNLTRRLAEQFSLNMLAPGLDGFEIRESSGSDKPLTNHTPTPSDIAQPLTSDESQTPLSPPVPGILCDETPESMAISVPGDKTPMISGLLMGTVLIGVGIASVIGLRLEEIQNSYLLGGAVGFIPGLVFIVIGLFNSSHRWIIDIDSKGFRIDGWKANDPLIIFTWGEVEVVTVSKRKPDNKLALFIGTSTRDFWMLPGVSKSRLVWIRQAILRQNPASNAPSLRSTQPRHITG